MLGTITTTVTGQFDLPFESLRRCNYGRWHVSLLLWLRIEYHHPLHLEHITFSPNFPPHFFDLQINSKKEIHSGMVQEVLPIHFLCRFATPTSAYCILLGNSHLPFLLTLTIPPLLPPPIWHSLMKHMNTQEREVEQNAAKLSCLLSFMSTCFCMLQFKQIGCARHAGSKVFFCSWHLLLRLYIWMWPNENHIAEVTIRKRSSASFLPDRPSCFLTLLK